MQTSVGPVHQEAVDPVDAGFQVSQCDTEINRRAVVEVGIHIRHGNLFHALQLMQIGRPYIVISQDLIMTRTGFCDAEMLSAPDQNPAQIGQEAVGMIGGQRDSGFIQKADAGLGTVRHICQRKSYIIQHPVPYHR